MRVMKEFWEDAGLAMMMSFGILMGTILLAMAVVMVCKRFVKQKRDQIRMSDAFDDSLLGEKGFGEKYVDAGDEDEVPPPLPPRPARKEEKLIDLEAGEGL
jgi:hypothetical protein